MDTKLEGGSDTAPASIAGLLRGLQDAARDFDPQGLTWSDDQARLGWRPALVDRPPRRVRRRPPLTARRVRPVVEPMPAHPSRPVPVHRVGHRPLRSAGRRLPAREPADRRRSALGADLTERIERFLSEQRAGRRAAPPDHLDNMGYDQGGVWDDTTVAS